MTLRELAEAILRLPIEEQHCPAVVLEPSDKGRTCYSVRLMVTDEDIATDNDVILAGQPFLG